MGQKVVKFSKLFQKTNQNIIPGYELTLGFTLFYLLIIVLIPLSFLISQAMTLSFSEFFDIITSVRILHAFKITFGTSLIAAIVNVFFGLLLSWVIVRYKFKGKGLLDALIDIPFALPTAIAGLALTALYAPNGFPGKILLFLGVEVAFTPIGIIMALIFVSIPFAVRIIQPVLEDIEKEEEETSASLGANRWQTFYRVMLPTLYPSLITAFTMSFARGLGEYGSVIFIAGNIPYVSEIVPLTIVIKLEENDYAAATAIAFMMLIISFFLLIIIKKVQYRYKMRF